MGSKPMFLTDRFLWARYMTVIHERRGKSVGKLLGNNSAHLNNIGKIFNPSASEDIST